MSREKQIEEMAKVMVDENNKEVVNALSMVFASSAEVLYTAGYRKASEVALEVIEEMIRMVDVKVIGIEEALAHGTAAHWDGIRRNCFEEILVEFAELKKKYTEGGE